MNREIGANPNIVWPRRVATAVLIAIGTTGCSAAGPQEIAGTEIPATPVECVSESLNGFDVEPQVEAIKQKIDNSLCDTANEAASQALVTYRENDILITSRDEGPDDNNPDVYSISYMKVTGTYVSVDFGMTAEGKPNLSDLQRVYINKDERDNDGKIIGSSTTSINRLDSGQWSMAHSTYSHGDLQSDWYFSPNDTVNQGEVSLVQDAYDKVFEYSLDFITV